jgi:hypothetical protein
MTDRRARIETQGERHEEDDQVGDRVLALWSGLPDCDVPTLPPSDAKRLTSLRNDQ